MSKRFTDTGKWSKFWFRKLSPKMKCVWLFLCDQCDHAGIWEIDLESFEYFVGEPVTIAEMLCEFGDRIEIKNDEKMFIRSFIDFQYGELNPENRVHQSVINRIKKLQIKPLISPLNGAKDKDKDKDKDIVLNNNKKNDEILDIDPIYEIYPRKIGKTKGVQKLRNQIKNENDLDLFRTAVLNYKNFVAKNKTESKFIKHFSTFVGEWRDWIDSTIANEPAQKKFENERVGEKFVNPVEEFLNGIGNNDDE
jgi:hypothetical protein